jgi:phosphopantetheine--protein transferase-like protein
MREPFPLLFARLHPFGFLVGVRLPPRAEVAAADVLTGLHASEAVVAESLAGFRYVEWVGGRLAAQIAGRHYGASDWSVGVGPGGEPLAPRGFTVSIAHKRNLAIALVAPEPDVGLGVDLENDGRAARAAAELVLSDDERDAIALLPRDRQERAFVVAFALKEAAYKALQKRAANSLVYRDARVSVDGDVQASVIVTMPDTATQPPLDVSVEWYGDHVVAAVKEVRGKPTENPIE